VRLNVYSGTKAAVAAIHGWPSDTPGTTAQAGVSGADVLRANETPIIDSSVFVIVLATEGYRQPLNRRTEQCAPVEVTPYLPGLYPSPRVGRGRRLPVDAGSISVRE